MTYSESPFSQLSDELWHVFGGRRRFPTTRDDWMASGDADEERPGTQGAGRGVAGGPLPLPDTDGEQLAGYSDSLWRLFRPPRENTGPERDEWPRWKQPE